MRRFCTLALGVVLAGLYWWGMGATVYAHHEIAHIDDNPVALPPRFVVRTVTSGLTLPTDMVILPSGDFLVTEKGTGTGPFSEAHVRLVRQGVLQPQPVLRLKVNTQEDSGLYSIVLDPQYAANGYYYLWYSTGEGSLGWEETTYNRLSRFVYDDGSGTSDPASETVILDDIPWSPLHNGGGLAFDGDGNLLIATGDAGSNYNEPPTHLAQNLQSLNGKVLRIRPRPGGGYDVPVGNPYIGHGNAARAEIYTLGLRNPFRMTRRAADQSVFVADVGQETWEEIDQLASGVNYGWPFREGRCQIGAREPDCTPTPTEFTDPVVAYPNPEDVGGGITALAFYEGTQWPEEYRGKLFFADFNSGWISMTELADPLQVITPFATDLPSLVDMEATPEGIYAISIYEQSILFISYADSDNLPPTAKLAATPVTGDAPLAVEFVAAEAQDADGDALTFGWNFGDGSVLTTTTVPTTTHVYTQDGDYLATLQITDERGEKSEILTQLIQVYSGALAFIRQDNLTEPGRELYRGGDQIRFSPVREGNTAGLDPVAPYDWTLLLHHNEHFHVQLSDYFSDELILDVPTTTHSLGAPLWYEVQLDMHTENGQVVRSIYELMPQTTTIQVESWPGPTIITVNSQLQTSDQPTLVIVGQEYVLEAPPNIIFDFNVGEFKNWVVTEGWPVANIAGETEIVPDRRLELIAPAEPKTFVAYYDYVGPAVNTYLPTVSN